MYRKFVLIALIVIFSHLKGLAQKEMVINPIPKPELALLNFISLDSTSNLNLNFFKENFRFGVPFKITNGINLIKRNKLIYMQILGSGALYKVQKKGKGNFAFIRLDSTYHSGVNFGGMNFFYKDTLFQYGGMGFWKIKDYFTFYSTKTNEWEIYNSNKKVPIYLSEDNGLYAYLDENKGRLYLSHTVHQQDFPNTLSTYTVDSCMAFNFKERTWENLGLLNPDLKKIGAKGEFFKSPYGPFLVFHSDLELYWLNFSNNQYGILNRNKQAEFREKWLKLYKGQPRHLFQFVMGDAFYLIRIEQDGQLTYEMIQLNDKDFVDPTAQKIYTNNFFTALYKKIEPGRPIIGNTLIVGFLIFIYSFIQKRRKKNKIPIEVQSILYKNFFSSLSIVEKELIQAMYQLQVKNEQISIKTINKIIGVQQKDTLTQNKSRSDYFLRINQKFMLATRSKEALIVKQREETDKRQYNYNINLPFIKPLELLILNNQ
jgi:hypothetical protein